MEIYSNTGLEFCKPLKKIENLSHISKLETRYLLHSSQGKLILKPCSHNQDFISLSLSLPLPPPPQSQIANRNWEEKNSKFTFC